MPCIDKYSNNQQTLTPWSETKCSRKLVQLFWTIPHLTGTMDLVTIVSPKLGLNITFIWWANQLLTVDALALRWQHAFRKTQGIGQADHYPLNCHEFGLMDQHPISDKIPLQGVYSTSAKPCKKPSCDANLSCLCWKCSWQWPEVNMRQHSNVTT